MLRTARDEDILRTLSCKVRVLSLRQLIETWWGASRSAKPNAKARLDELVGEGLVLRDMVLAHPMLPLEAPVVAWAPGDAAPDHEAVAQHLQDRWTGAPRGTTVYTASRATANEFGGFGGDLKDRYHATHDLHLGALYLCLRRTTPDLAAAWMSEDFLKLAGKRSVLPDAELHDQQGKPFRVVEFCGTYPPERLRDIHEDCRARGVAYELW